MRTRYNASESLLLGATSYTTAYNYGLAPLPFRTFTPYSRNVVYAGNDKQNSRRPQLNLQHVPFEGLGNIEILGRSQKGIGYQTHISTRTTPCQISKASIGWSLWAVHEYISGNLGFRDCSGVFVAPYGVLEHTPCPFQWCQFAQIVPMPPDLPDPVKRFFQMYHKLPDILYW
jgi:hypothetical protein